MAWTNAPVFIAVFLPIVLRNDYDSFLFVRAKENDDVSLPEVSAAHESCFIEAEAWKLPSAVNKTAYFPELEYVTDRPNTALCLSGGGLFDNIRYITGVSGGAWATSVFTFSQLNISDAELLGSIMPPDRLSRYYLKKMSPLCARSFAAGNIVEYAVRRLISGAVSTVSGAWVDAVYHMYLKPAGVSKDSLLSWSPSTVADIVDRNPFLADTQFLIPTRAHRPFPVLTSTLVGPKALAPYISSRHNFTRIEFTPLYTGVSRTSVIAYEQSIPLTELAHSHSHTQLVGGYLETFAVSVDGTTPVAGIPEDSLTDILRVPCPQTYPSPADSTATSRSGAAGLSLEFAVAASSFAPGTLLAALPERFADDVSMEFNYWSPAAAQPHSQRNFIADGGSSENVNLISMLQRGVCKVILVLNTGTPLQPTRKWNVLEDEPTETQIDIDLQAYFGIFPMRISLIDSLTEDLSKNVVFPRSSWALVATTLQAKQAVGNGIVAAFNLTTVENEWWGIPEGQAVELVLLYMGRAHRWEASLPADLRQLVTPSRDASDLSRTVEAGPFRGFPHYATTGGSLNFEKSNLLANFFGWIVLQHTDLFN